MNVAIPLREVPARSRRAGMVGWAFLRMGARSNLSYPLSFVLIQLTGVVQVVGFYFLQRLIHPSQAVGSGYLTFAAIGFAGTQITLAGVVGLGQEIDWAVQQGRFEMMLIEPVSWRLIPLALAAWPALTRCLMAVLILFAGWCLGATYLPGALPSVFLLAILGIGGGLVIGVAAGALRILAKRGDPIATIYQMLCYVFTGQFVPINLFPYPMRVLSWVFPSTYVISGMRKALMPDSAHIYGPDPGQAMLLLLGWCVFLLPVSLWLFGKSLQVGRRYGVLAGY